MSVGEIDDMTLIISRGCSPLLQRLTPHPSMSLAFSIAMTA